MKIETLSERVANAENKIGKKQLTIVKKKTLIVKKQQLIEAKDFANSDNPEALTLKWDIEHYTDDISRLEREIAEATLTLDNYRKQLTGLMERVSVLIKDMPNVLKGLQKELVDVGINGILSVGTEYKQITVSLTTRNFQEDTPTLMFCSRANQTSRYTMIIFSQPKI